LPQETGAATKRAMSGSIKHPFFWKLHHLTDIFGAKYEQIKINHLEAYPFRAISRSNKN
jgi:hypothetical protein